MSKLTCKRGMLLAVALSMGIAGSAAAKPSALDQLRAAAGGNADHVFDGSKSNGSRPAPMPSTPPVGASGPVQQPSSGQKK